MSEKYQVLILEAASNQGVEASLIVDMERESVVAAQQAFTLFHSKNGGKPEHAHWDWSKKFQLTIDYSLTYRMLGIECGGQMQGLMLIASGKDCRIESQKGKNLVYVDYLSAAPWNSKATTATPTYKLVGKVLLQAAIELSLDEGFKGRIGLHSLPQSETWYVNCGMTDLGIDADYQKLRYFEMTPEQAAAFTQG
jgi:hypothetical protein